MMRELEVLKKQLFSKLQNPSDWINNLMNTRNNDVLPSLDVQRRKEEEMKQRKMHQTEMDSRMINRESRDFSQSVSATTDTKMVDALAKVRQSKVSMPDELTCRNGSWMFDKSLKKQWRILPMQKYPYQTCIRLPENLRDSMQTICDQYQINESDYIRKSISESVKSDLPKTENLQDTKFMFV